MANDLYYRPHNMIDNNNNIYIEKFKNLLRDDKKIILTHKGERYKFRTITSVPYCKVNETDTCPHCGAGSSQIYVARSKKIIFFVWYWDGCMTYDPKHSINSFNNEDQFREFLESHKSYSDILDELYPKSESSTSESSTDSY